MMHPGSMVAILLVPFKPDLLNWPVLIVSPNALQGGEGIHPTYGIPASV
jgi:hypothetical protein